MSSAFRHRVLIVDDDEALLTTTAAVLAQNGYEVATSTDGFQALVVLRGAMPSVLISDLNMPNMSGFELLGVVRKRFPSMAVIVFSGEFAPATHENVLADKFVAKGENALFELMEAVHEVLSEFPLRSQPAKPDSNPVWVPRSKRGYVVLTCTLCLRSTSIHSRELPVGDVAIGSCIHCGAQLRYRLDGTTGIEPARNVAEESRARAEATRRTLEDTQRAIADSKKLI